MGGFTWNGHFDWINVPSREKERLEKVCGDKADICPTYSPTMAGGLFAIARDYFWDIGSYDEQMDGWGGENLEMSFRIWQCNFEIIFLILYLIFFEIFILIFDCIPKVEARLKPFHAAAWATYSATSIRTNSQIIEILTVLTPCDWQWSGWTNI